MATKFLLEQAILGPRVQLPISEQRYKEIAHAREVLSEALTFEQRYELLLGNFISLELSFTEICLRSAVEPEYRYPEMAETLRQANRHVVNVLTAMRGYADQVPQDFKCLQRPRKFAQLAKAELVKLFERSPDYRFLCGLRNHVQHKAEAIHGWESSETTREDANGWAEHIRFYARNASLRGDPDFKRRILDEQPEKIDVRRCTRRAVHELGASHIELRKQVAKEVQNARSTFEAAILDYKNAGAESVVGLCARRASSQASSTVSVLLNWDDVRVQLVEKNDQPPSLWPRPNHRTPKVEQISSLRAQAQHSKAQAAAAIFVSEQRWQDFEEGLAMPEGLFHLYQLQTKLHPSHRIVRRSAKNKNG